MAAVANIMTTSIELGQKVYSILGPHDDIYTSALDEPGLCCAYNRCYELCVKLNNEYQQKNPSNREAESRRRQQLA